MSKAEMRCPICDNTDKWENVDQYREKEQGMHICNGCGFVGYPLKYMSEDEAKAYYEKDYRKPPTFGNLTTGNRKLQMHAKFLDETFTKWQEDKKENPVVCDIGAAYGMFLNWVKSNFPKAELNGTEFAQAYRRTSFHEYGIELTKDFDKTKKYDLIASFKVAEHQLDPDKRLREYVECLKEDGLMYVSVPTWFGKMTNFGLGGFDLEYYYHPDHINVWSKRLFEILLKKVGLEIVKFDGVLYDETYLCKRNDSLMSENIQYEDPNKIKEDLKNIKTAWDLYKKRDMAGAIKAFPNFFEAHQANYELSRKNPHEKKEQMPLEYIIKNHLDPCKAACGESLDFLRLAVDIHMRYDDFRKAIEYIERSLSLRPNNTPFLTALSHCYRELALRSKEPKAKLDYLNESRSVWKYIRTIDVQSKGEATNWIYQLSSEIPTPNEIQT